MTVRSRTRGLRGGLAAATALLAFALSSACSLASASSVSATMSATPSATPYLLKPTGPHPVGTTSLYLKDTSRPDPWVPQQKARELMVTLWYPATSPGRQRPQYMTPKESELLLKGEGITGVPYDALSRVRTDAFSDATPAGRRHGLPLVVLSPGFQVTRKTQSGLAEDLASHGYVVAGIDHTYENFGETFPDGRITTCVACKAVQDPGFITKLMHVRAADVSFVIDELAGRHPAWKGASLIDPSRIAMAGHSLGGASAIAAMLKDSRLRAGIDMDGTTYASIPDSGLPRPFLFLGTQANHSPGGPDTSWDRDWKLLTGWKRWLVVAGAQHMSFTDLGLLNDQLGLGHNAVLPGSRGMQITRRYVLAFFDLHLRNQPQPLLDKPSKRYPELKFCSPGTNTCR